MQLGDTDTYARRSADHGPNSVAETDIGIVQPVIQAMSDELFGERESSAPFGLNI